MSLSLLNDIDDLLPAVPVLARRLEDVHVSCRDLGHDVSSMDTLLDEMIGSVDIMNQRLFRKKHESKAVVTPPAQGAIPPRINPLAGHAPVPAGMTLEDLKLHMDEILKCSLDAVSDKLSDRISGMLRDLGALSGAAREVKLQELKQSGEYDMVDFSTLSRYASKQVTSNLKDVGVDERESTNINSTLERLRQRRAGKPKV